MPHQPTTKAGTMLILVDPHSGVPVYRQLMDQIKLHIASGQLQAGAELPSTRTLSTELGINPMTISKAYGFLEVEGVVERRPGRPLVVATLDPATLQAARTDQLRESLEPAVRIAHQLGIQGRDALDLFGEMLESWRRPTGTNEREEQ